MRTRTWTSVPTEFCREISDKRLVLNYKYIFILCVELDHEDLPLSYFRLPGHVRLSELGRLEQGC